MTLLAPLLALALAAEPAPAPPPTARALVEANAAARGGAARLAALRAVGLVGRAVLGDGPTLRVAILRARPGLLRQEATLQGLTQVRAIDGAGGWTIDPFQGRRDPERLDADQLRALGEEAPPEGPLQAAAARGEPIAYLGTEELEGSPAHVLRIDHRDGDLTTVYLDAVELLEVRVVERRTVHGAIEEERIDLGDYQRVGDLWFPFAIERRLPGDRRIRIAVERLVVDPPIDEALFRFPDAGAPAAGAVTAALSRAEAAPAAASPAAASPAAASPAAASPAAASPAAASPAAASPAAASPATASPATASPATASPAPRPAEAAAPAPAPSLDAGALSGLGARAIGPAATSGRVSAVAAVKRGGRTTIFVGAASGGVWRSTDDGTTFEPVFDRQPVQSIGAIAVDPRDPRTIWVGTGEAWTRNSVSFGDGIYRSTDGGDTWTNMGLPSSERIARILVDPRDGDVVWACVPGKLWADSPDRGLYRTADGGRSWTLVLAGANLSTGCASIALDPGAPDTVYAGLWDFRRTGWSFRSGGDGPTAPSGSSLWKTVDGGRSWSRLDRATAPGLPAGPWGRIALAVAPSRPRIVYAFVESPRSALYRSDDGGRTWAERDRSQLMVWRPFYFANLIVDPRDEDTVYKTDAGLIRSTDGGRSFARVSGRAHGDFHDLWLDPDDAAHAIAGDDGGLWISRDGANRWWKAANLPIAQYYHVAVDGRDPYQVYGGLQDNAAWVGDSAYPGGVTNSRWENVGGGDGFWVLPDPTNPDHLYEESQGGDLGRVDRRTLQRRSIQPLPAPGETLRFNWNTPLLLSPGEPGTLYAGAQFLFRTRDHGQRWERIFPDLTTDDPAKKRQERSGGVTVDNSSAETHCTIVTIAESPLDPRRLWVGTDDGNLQRTDDGGAHWAEVGHAVPGLPAGSWVSWVEASRHDAATAYATFDRHAAGDLAPYLYRTTDLGRTWTRLAGPAQGVEGYAHVVREDPVRPGILYLGTELGLWISIDGGERWARFRGGRMPAVAVRDLAFQERDRDLVVAIHGRGLWIVDDLTPLRALDAATLGRPVALLPGRPAQQRLPASGGWPEGDAAFTGPNPPDGAVITIWQATRELRGRRSLDVLDGDGRTVDTLPVPARRGIVRVTWPMREPPPLVPPAAQVAFGAAEGPRVPPGRYTVRLRTGDGTLEAPLDVGIDRRAPYGLEDRRAGHDALARLSALFGEMTALVERIEATRDRAAAAASALPRGDSRRARLEALGAAATALRGRIVATTEGGAITGEERLREKADQLYGALDDWEGRPTDDQLGRIASLAADLAAVARDESTLEAR